METCLFSATAFSALGHTGVELLEWSWEKTSVDSKSLFLQCVTFIQLETSSLIDTQDFLKAKHSMFYLKKKYIF